MSSATPAGTTVTKGSNSLSAIFLRVMVLWQAAKMTPCLARAAMRSACAALLLSIIPMPPPWPTTSNMVVPGP
ncbi:hypothetical protein D3C72_2435030 [compost metagenome]